MKPMPWRILVLTDAGADTGQSVHLEPGGADAWLEATLATVEIPKPGGGTVKLAPRNAAGFEPAAVRAALGDGAAPAAVDAALHAPAFQRLESAYRGIARLLEHAGDAIAVEVQSIPRKGLAGRFHQTAFARERADDGLALVVGDYDFGHKGDDLSTLSEMGTMCATLQAPFVAHAAASFFDFRYFGQAAALPEILGRLNTPGHQTWREFQATDAARWVALTVNRWLERAPYRDGHAEAVTESNPDSYLWGRGGWLVAAAVARSARENGHALAIAGGQGGSFTGMPVREFPVNANTTAPLATESSITDTQLIELSRAAFIPLVGPLRASVVTLPNVMTVFRLKPATPTLEGVLAYQILAGRLAQFCGRLLNEMPQDAATAAGFVRESLVEYLGKLGGETADRTVMTEVRQDNGSAYVAVLVKPQVVLEGKPVEFEFGLPLGA